MNDTILCPKLTSVDPENVIITADNVKELNVDTYNRTVGTQVRVSCWYDYQLVGNPELECLANGNWSQSPLPTCSDPVQCPALTSIDPNNVIITANNVRELKVNTYQRTVGTKVQVSCRFEYELVGNENLECLAQGRWSESPLPYCALPTDPADQNDTNTNGLTTEEARILTAILVVVSVFVIVVIVVICLAIYCTKRRRLAQKEATIRHHYSVYDGSSSSGDSESRDGRDRNQTINMYHIGAPDQQYTNYQTEVTRTSNHPVPLGDSSFSQRWIQNIQTDEHQDSRNYAAKGRYVEPGNKIRGEQGDQLWVPAPSAPVPQVQKSAHRRLNTSIDNYDSDAYRRQQWPYGSLYLPGYPYSQNHGRTSKYNRGETKSYSDVEQTSLRLKDLQVYGYGRNWRDPFLWGNIDSTMAIRIPRPDYA